MDEAADPERIEDTPWLDEQEREAWLALAALMMFLPSALDAQLQRDAGLSHFEYLVLAGLSEAPERTRRMSELAAVANGSLSRLSHVVSRLQRQGWVTRRPDPADRRTTLASLTEQGWAKVVASAPRHVTTVRQVVFDQLTRTQARHLKDACTRVLGGLGPVPAEGFGTSAARPDRPGAP